MGYLYSGSPQCQWVGRLGCDGEHRGSCRGEVRRTQWALLHPLAKSFTHARDLEGDCPARRGSD